MEGKGRKKLGKKDIHRKPQPDMWSYTNGHVQIWSVTMVRKLAKIV